MLDFYGMEYSGNDHPNKYSLILYTSGCNFRCFGCHNRKLAGWDYDKNGNKINVNPKKYHKKLDNDDLELAIENNLIDLVILCGGEVLINNIEDIKETINYIKSKNNIPIRIDTNGSFPEKVKELKDGGFVDGFAIDIKGPYWDDNYKKDICKIIGINEDVSSILFSKIVESLYIAKDMEYTLYRTVKYPIIKDEAYFQEIRNYADKYLMGKHSFNKFIDIADLLLTLTDKNENDKEKIGYNLQYSY